MNCFQIEESKITIDRQMGIKFQYSRENQLMFKYINQNDVDSHILTKAGGLDGLRIIKTYSETDFISIYAQFNGNCKQIS